MKLPRIETSGGVPCPRCGSPSSVLRVTRGRRVKNSRRDVVVRERQCLRRRTHRFTTEERAR
jgi:hypothetical protein